MFRHSSQMAIGPDQTLPAKQTARSITNTTAIDCLSHFLDEPFRTWQSTFLFGVVSVILAVVAIFLGIRYMEACQFKSYDCCKASLTLEGQSNPDMDKKASKLRGYSASETPGTPQAHPSIDLEADIRRQFRLHCIQASNVAIGEVRQGRIAQRRASLSRGI